MDGLRTSASRGLCAKSLMGNGGSEAADGNGRPDVGRGQSQRHKWDEEMGTAAAPEGEHHDQKKGNDGAGPRLQLRLMNAREH